MVSSGGSPDSGVTVPVTDTLQCQVPSISFPFYPVRSPLSGRNKHFHFPLPPLLPTLFQALSKELMSTIALMCFLPEISKHLTLFLKMHVWLAQSGSQVTKVLALHT